MTDEDYDLAGPAQDGPDRAAPPALTYALCSSPRSGSTLLSEALTFLGCGVPIEYFDPTNTMRVVWERWGCRSLDEYIATLHSRRCSPEGIFGLKVHWFQLEALSRKLGPPLTGANPIEAQSFALQQVAPTPIVIRVVRDDRQRQALSWARAERTGCWRSPTTGEAPPPPTVSPAEQEHYLRRLSAEDAGWEVLLDHLGIDPVVVHYEDLRDDYAGTVEAVARRVGAAKIAAVPPPRLVRQS